MPVQADSIYECKDMHGNPVFSTQSCGDDAKEVTIDVVPPSSSKPEKQNSAVWDEIAISNRLRELDREIAQREKKKDSLAVKRDQEYERLRVSRDNQPRTPEGKKKRSEIRLKMKAVYRRYNKLNSREHEEIGKLQNERRQLLKRQTQN